MDRRPRLTGRSAIHEDGAGHADREQAEAGDAGTPRPTRRSSKSRPKPKAPPLTSAVAISTRTTTRLERAVARPRRSVAAETAHRRVARRGALVSGHRATTPRPSPTVPAPATTIAAD